MYLQRHYAMRLNIAHIMTQFTVFDNTMMHVIKKKVY